MSGLKNIKRKLRIYFSALLVIAGMFLAGGSSSFIFAEERAQPQTVFKSPEEAMQGLVSAVQTGETQKIMAVLGPGSKDAIYSGDEVADKNNRAKFVNAYREKVDFVKDKNRVSVIIGKDNYPMAIPIIKKDTGWEFDTDAGIQELLKRRIGRNELNTIKSCREYVQAQKEYSGVDRGGDGVMEYAQKFCSTPGKRDGLFWQEAEGEGPSPLGQLFVAASKEGYTPGQVCMIYPVPYRGYHYKILTAQGADAPAGAYNYVINGHMVAGFGLVAWPAEYGVSGVMTFIVNQNGIIYEKDLGPGTEKITKTMTEYNPDSTWSVAQ